MARATSLRVIITGASSGLGQALAERYAAQGATLGLIARREAELKELAARYDSPSRIYALDVRDAAGLVAAAGDFMAHHGCPDVVIANAGVSFGTRTEYAEDVQAFQDVLDINVLGMVKTFQPFVAKMRERRRGLLVGIASVAGYRGLPGAGAYSASKAAAISYLESLRVELKRSGVNVITVCPGFYRYAAYGTESLSDAVPDERRHRRAKNHIDHRARQDFRRDSVADGGRRAHAARHAQLALRSAVCRRAAQAAAIVRNQGRFALIRP